MTVEGAGGRYRAFISYSHKDARFGRRLHRRLESYRVPRRLVGRETPQGLVPTRLAPIFRDREELPAAHDLSTEVRAALGRSETLIVICSPAASASPWVAREVEVFRELHPDRPVLAAIIDGDPADCFPEALRRMGDGAPTEPLAADFRPGGDGAQLGLLKLAAGIVGIGLDELVQRDAQRRLQRVTAVTAASIAAMLAMGLLTIFALNARTDAERQRAEAEGLVEFMLTDLRDKLRGVGRLDVLTAVNERVLRHYRDQDLKTLPVSSLERRARLLHAMGEDDETLGDDHAALADFREANRTTAALLARAPNDPDRIFDQAQSEFWLGSVDYRSGQVAKAKVAFQAYKQLADRLTAISPDNPTYRKEVGYADGNLCSADLAKPRDIPGALQSCKAALKEVEDAPRRPEEAKTFANALINRHAWLANAYYFAGDHAQAKDQRLIEKEMLDPLMAADPKNMDLKDTWIALQRGLAALEIAAGQKAAARARITRALTTVETMIAFDPTNTRWRTLKSHLVQDAEEIDKDPE